MSALVFLDELQRVQLNISMHYLKILLLAAGPLPGVSRRPAAGAAAGGEGHDGGHPWLGQQALAGSAFATIAYQIGFVHSCN